MSFALPPRGIPPLIEALTPKEHEILVLLCNGLSNREIARRAGISVDGVKWHLRNLYGKLGAVRRTQAVAIAVHLDLVRPAWLLRANGRGDWTIAAV